MNKRTNAIIYSLLALGLIILIVVVSRSGSAPNNTNDSAETNANIPAAAQISTSDHTKGGTQTAPATLIEYGDFQCPACGAYTPVVAGLKDHFGNRLRIVFRHFPLTQIHRNAMQASLAAEAAGMQDKFWEMHDLLFDRQGQWSTLSASTFLETLTAYATELGLDTVQFESDMESTESKNKIAADTKSGNQLGVNGTPTFFLNGKKLQNPASTQAFIDLIEAEIGDASVAPVSTNDLSQNEYVHEHANFAVYLNGKKLDFSLAKYQSDEVDVNDPNHDHDSHEHDPYTHLHDGVGNVIHKHKAGVTMGYFLGTLGMELTNTCFTDDNGTAYCNGDGNSLKFFLNGNRVQSLADYELTDLDQILISYGPLVDSALEQQLASITDDACVYSELCPERGEAPTENCVGGLGTNCEQ